jgi:hypothetical protein
LTKIIYNLYNVNISGDGEEKEVMYLKGEANKNLCQKQDFTGRRTDYVKEKDRVLGGAIDFLDSRLGANYSFTGSPCGLSDEDHRVCDPVESGISKRYGYPDDF